MVTFFVPVFKEADALVFRNRIQEPYDLGIAVNRHLFCKERMCERVVRIVMAGVLFFDNQVGDKIKDESGIVPEPLPQHWHQFVFLQYFLDDDIGADLKTGAPVSEWKFFRDIGIREIHLILFVREHP